VSIQQATHICAFNISADISLHLRSVCISVLHSSLLCTFGFVIRYIFPVFHLWKWQSDCCWFHPFQFCHVITENIVHRLQDLFLLEWVKGNVWSMKWTVPGQEVDQRKLGETLWKKTVRHVDWTGRMPWIILDGWSRLGTFDDHDRCEWVNVSSGTGSAGLSQTKSRELCVCVCVCACVHAWVCACVCACCGCGVLCCLYKSWACLLLVHSVADSSGILCCLCKSGACLPARVTSQYARCHLSSDCELTTLSAVLAPPPPPLVCVRPRLDNITRLVTISRLNKPTVVFLGRPLDLLYAGIFLSVCLSIKVKVK